MEGLKTHDTAYDSFYEIKIPFSALGITRQWLEANGIGCRMIATRGESAIDCIPFDPSMVDNTFGEYGKDNSTTHEKDDLDVITYAMADIAKVRDLGSVDPLPDPDPEPEPEPEPEPGTDPEPTPDGAYIAYFDDSTWSAVFTYVWDKGNADKPYAGNWPGSSATKVSINARSTWHLSFTTDDTLVKPMIIWNNGSGGSGGTGNQTDDFEFVNHGVYTMNGFSGETIADESSVADIAVDSSHTATYYNLMGRPVANPSHGIFIRHNADGSTSKVRL